MMMMMMACPGNGTCEESWESDFNSKHSLSQGVVKCIL
jgi:hypothetical protein